MAARRPLVDVGGRVKQLPSGDRLDLPLATTAEPGLMAAADKAKLNGVGTAASLSAGDVITVGRFGYGQPIVSDEVDANKYTTEGNYLTPAGGLVNFPPGYALSRAFVRVHYRFGYIVQEVFDTQGFKLLAWRGANGHLAGIQWSVAVNRPVQSGLHTKANDGNTLALAGAFGFGGNPGLLGERVPLSALLENYGITKVLRVEDGTAGMFSYTPILHVGGIDTWWQLQIDYSSGVVRIAHGIGATRHGVKNLITESDVQATIAAAKPAPVLEIATSITISLSHANQFLWATTSSALTITIPSNSSVAFPVGAEIHLGAFTAGSITLSASSGVTLDLPNGGSAVLAPNMNATLKKMQTNRWRLIGQTVAA